MYNKLVFNDFHLIKESFRLAEASLKNTQNESNFSGSTCNLGIIINKKIICANVGDSRMILLEEQSDTTLTDIQLSNDHKPELEIEKERIEKSGGVISPFESNKIIQFIVKDSNGPLRVFVKGEKYPGIAMSRSLGDFVAKTVGVICDPGK